MAQIEKRISQKIKVRNVLSQWSNGMPLGHCYTRLKQIFEEE